MKIKKYIKRIIALVAGISMLGATITGAMATANLANYPQPYINNGMFNGMFVVGANAMTADVLGIVDIATALQYENKIDTIVSNDNTITNYELSGDVYKISTSSDILNLNEALGKVKSTITKENIGILGSTVIRTQKGSTDADQYLKFNSDVTGLRPVYDKNRDNIVTNFLKADNNANLFTYELQFPEGLKSSAFESISSNVKVTSGTATLNDINNNNLYILGQTFNIGDSSIIKGGQVRLTLMGGQITDTIIELQSKTYTINNVSYEISVPIIADANTNGVKKVLFTINGESTKPLQEGDTQIMDDGTVIGITSILAKSGEGKGFVTFYFGAHKVELIDPDYSDSSNSGSTVKIDDVTMNNAVVEIEAVWNTDEVTINSLKYSIKADSVENGDLFIPVNSTLKSMLDQPSSMLSDNWDVRYLGMSGSAEPSKIVMSPSGDDSYYLEFTNQEGIHYNIPFVDTSNDKGNGFKFGTEDNKLVFKESSICNNYNDAPIDMDDYFIVNRNTETDKAFTRVLTFNRVGISNGILTLADASDRSTKEITFNKNEVNTSGCANAKNDLIVGGESYKVAVCSDNTEIDTHYRLCVDLDGNGNVADGAITDLVVQGGGIISFEDAWSYGSPGGYNIDIRNGTIGNETQINLAFTTLAKYTDNNQDESFDFYVVDGSVGTRRQVDTSYIEKTSIGLKKEKEKDSDYKTGSTAYGVYVKEYDPSSSSDAGSLTIEIPNQQTEAKVYVIGQGTTMQGVVNNGGITVSEYSPIKVGTAVLDSEVSGFGENMIVVGGPCANTIAATLLDLPATKPGCYENFPVQEGSGIIRMIEKGDKISIVVAGYSAQDTRDAARIMASHKNYKDFNGTSLIVSKDKITQANPIPLVNTVNVTNTTG